MKLRHLVFSASLLLIPAALYAQDFGVMESAETVDQGNFKLKINPMFILGDGDTTTGVAGGFGYGFTNRLDVEANVAGYDGLVFLGGNVEYWLVKGGSLDVSASAGFHYINSDFGDQTGVKLMAIASHAVTPRLDIYGALNLAFRKFRDDFPDSSYTQAHLVPGIEYKLHKDLDLLAEIGIAVNDDSDHYVSVGLASCVARRCVFDVVFGFRVDR